MPDNLTHKERLAVYEKARAHMRAAKKTMDEVSDMLRRDFIYGRVTSAIEAETIGALRTHVYHVRSILEDAIFETQMALTVMRSGRQADIKHGLAKADDDD